MFCFVLNILYSNDFFGIGIGNDNLSDCLFVITNHLMLQVILLYVNCCDCFVVHHYMLQFFLVSMSDFMHSEKFSF